VENGRPSIFSVQGVINPARFVCTFGSSHLGILSEFNSPEKSPDTFVFAVAAKDYFAKLTLEEQRIVESNALARGNRF
jgi:hypothetical protein